MIVWNAEKISALDTDQVKSLRVNATKLGHPETVDLCDAELKKRKPAKPAKPATINEDRDGDAVPT